MSDSDSDFGTPNKTSTQVTPDKVNNAKNKSNFKSKLGTKIGGTSAVNNFLKLKALGSKAKDGAVPTTPILPKLKAFDDEVDTRCSAKKKQSKSQSDLSSSSEANSSSSSDEEDTKTKKPLHQNDDGSSASDNEVNNTGAKTKAKPKSISDKVDKKVNIVSNTVVKKGLNKPDIKEEVKSTSGSDSSSEESSSSDDDDNDNKDKKNGTSNNISASSSSSEGSSDSESSSDDDNNNSKQSSSGSSSSDDSSSDSSTESTKREMGTSGYNSKSGNVSSSVDSSDDEENISQGAMTVQATKKTKKVLSNYIDKHGMDPCDKRTSSFNIYEDINQDDEVFTVKVSKQIDPKLLNGQALKIIKEQSINIDNENYLAEFDKDEKTDLCLLGPSGNEFVVRQVKTKGCFVINKQYKINKSNDSNINRDAAVKQEKMPFPIDKIKQRHPIFGNNFEKRITLDKNVSKKLDNLMNNMLKSFEKPDSKLDKVEKKKTKKTDVSCDDNNVKVKKKKKRKRDETDMSTEVNESKKRKKDSMNIESILSSFGDASKANEIDDALPKKRKKKKDKSREHIEHSDNIIGTDTQSAFVDTTIKYKKMKDKAIVDSASNAQEFKSPKKPINKHLTNIANSTMCSPSLGKALFEPDTSIIEKSVEKKRKKSKKVEKEEVVEASNNSSKKHKKDKNLSDSQIIVSNTSKDKKKKKSKKSKKSDEELESIVSSSLKGITNDNTAYQNDDDIVKDAPKKTKKRRPTMG